MKTFEEGLGRIMFVSGALEHDRPFLGPLYKFLTLHPRNAVRRVPPCVAFFLNFLSRSVSAGRHHDCNQFLDKACVSPRVDAQASSSRTGIGGWFPHVDEYGAIDPWKSFWFSVEISAEHFPWVYERGETLEALAVLIALKLYYGDTPGRDVTSVTLVPTFTDSRCNGSALNKLMSTKYASSAILMELSILLKHRQTQSAGRMDTPRHEQGSRFVGQRTY